MLSNYISAQYKKNAGCRQSSPAQKCQNTTKCPQQRRGKIDIGSTPQSKTQNDAKSDLQRWTEMWRIVGTKT